MKQPKKEKITGWQKRARRVRTKVRGNAERPRLSVYRSLKNVYAQLIDDDLGVSLVGVSSACREIQDQKLDSGKTAVAKAVGKLIAEKAKEQGISQAVFDRGGYLYHGRVKAVAEGAREGGLNF